MKKFIASVLTLALVAGLGSIFIFADETAVQDPGTSRGAANNAKGSLGLFDKLGVVDASVNQFTGDLTLSVPLVSLPGHNGLDLNIALSYSSDVAYIMRTTKITFNKQGGWEQGGA